MPSRLLFGLLLVLSNIFDSLNKKKNQDFIIYHLYLFLTFLKYYSIKAVSYISINNIN